MDIDNMKRVHEYKTYKQGWMVRQWVNDSHDGVLSRAQANIPAFVRQWLQRHIPFRYHVFSLQVNWYEKTRKGLLLGEHWDSPLLLTDFVLLWALHGQHNLQFEQLQHPFLIDENSALLIRGHLFQRDGQWGKHRAVPLGNSPTGTVIVRFNELR